MLYWVFLTPVNFKVQRSKEEGKPRVEGKKGGEGNTGTKRILYHYSTIVLRESMYRWIKFYMRNSCFLCKQFGSFQTVSY